MLKKLTADPALLFLLLGNLYCIWFYEAVPGSFNNIIWIYWCQSMIIGLFNFVYLLTSKNATKDLEKNSNSKVFSGGCNAFFFLFHYGVFHIVYFFFIIIKYDLHEVSFVFTLIAVGIFILESLSQFVRQKRFTKTHEVNEAFVFFIPYLRVLPMHLIILAPAFLNIKPSILFLILKTITDLLSYKILKNMYRERVYY